MFVIYNFNTGNIGPVLIQSGIKTAGYDGTGNVSPATLKKLNCPIDGSTIKTRKHKGALDPGENLSADSPFRAASLPEDAYSKRRRPSQPALKNFASSSMYCMASSFGMAWTMGSHTAAK